MIMKRKFPTILLISVISCNVIAGDIKNRIYTAKAPAPIGTYSQGIQFGNTIYISGQIPIDTETGELVKGNFKDQIRQVFRNISEIAKAAGSNLNNILKLTIYVTDINKFNDINDIMKEYFDQPYPARAVIEIKALPKNAAIEMEATIATTQVIRFTPVKRRKLSSTIP